MNRRGYLITAGGALTAIVGEATVATTTRADILVDGELVRGEGELATIERTITRDSVEYVASADEVRENGETEPFAQWARRECAEIGAESIVSLVDDRIKEDLTGVGSGVRALAFGPVITVGHNVTRDRDGNVTSRPNVALERLVSVAPRTVTITIVVSGQEATRKFPVGVSCREEEWNRQLIDSKIVPRSGP